MGKKKAYPLTREWRFGKRSAKPAQEPKPATPTDRRGGKGNAPSNTRICENCGQKTFYNASTGLNAPHQWASNGRWCKGGREPSKKERKAASRRRSVHATSAGLPGLGKRA